MKYYSPLPPEVIDIFCKCNEVSGLKLYMLEKLTQLDAEILMTYNKTQLGKLYRIHRQTVASHITELIDKNIILETTIGNIISLPTATGFFGVYYGQYEGLYRFVLTLPNTNIHYYVYILKDEFKQRQHQSLILGFCYYLQTNIKILSTLKLNSKHNCYYLPFLAVNCIDLYLIDNIGYEYKNKQFLKKYNHTSGNRDD